MGCVLAVAAFIGSQLFHPRTISNDEPDVIRQTPFELDRITPLDPSKTR